MRLRAPRRSAVPAGVLHARRSPYQGLAPYAEEDAEYFFGRDAWQEVITDHLLAYRVTLVYGASGVGKSSVLRAGVAHELRELARHNLEQFGSPEVVPVVCASWRGDALTSVRHAVESSIAALGLEPTEPHASATLADALAAWGEKADARILLIVDQFDEYFTYHEQEDAFAAELAEAASRREVPANFMISIREDALAKLDRFQDTIPGLWDNLLRVDHLDRDAAREAIEKPVIHWNEVDARPGEAVELEAGIVDAVLAEAGPRSVHIGHAGRGTVEREDDSDGDDALVEAPYLQLVMTRLWQEERRRGSLTLRVDTLRRMGGADEIVRSHFDGVMRSLSRRRRRVAARIFAYLVTPSGTKIALSPSALASWSKVKEKRVAPVLQTLADADRRILRTVATPGERGAVSYEIFHDRLAAGILDWRRRYRRRRTRRRAAAGFLVVAAVAASVIYGQQDRYASLESEVDFLKEQRLVETDAGRSPNFVAIASGHTAAVNSVAFSPDGRDVITASEDESVRVARAISGTNERTIEVGEVATRAAFSPDGRLIGIETQSGWAGVWASGGRRFKVPATSTYNSLAFAPDGRHILTANDDGTAQLWDVRNGRSAMTFRSPEKQLDTAALSADGRSLVTTAGGSVRVWDVRSGRQVGPPLRSRDSIYAVMSPDGRSLVTVGVGGADLWRFSENGARRSRLAVNPRIGADAPYDVSGGAALSPDGRIAVVGERNVTLFDQIGRPVTLLRGHADVVNAVRFSPDGQLLATASSDETARVWNGHTGRALRVLKGHRGPVTWLDFSPDGQYLVTAGADGTAIVWNATGRPDLVLGTPQTRVSSGRAQVIVDVRNAGQAASAPTTLEADLSTADRFLVAGRADVPGLKPGDATAVAMELRLPRGDVEVVVNLRLDPGNKTSDADESNDSLSVPLAPAPG